MEFKTKNPFALVKIKKIKINKDVLQRYISNETRKQNDSIKLKNVNMSVFKFFFY